jgi:DNA-binding response OmpR family regulator
MSSPRALQSGSTWGVSGLSLKATVIDAVNRGAVFSYLVKPCNPAVLRTNVREASRFYRESLLQSAAVTRNTHLPGSGRS